MKKHEIRDLVDKEVLQHKPDEELLTTELNNLVNDGFLQQLPNEFFAFNSNLTWEVIYETLLFAERRHLHNLVAKHIELFNKDNLESVADLLLHHFSEANNWKKCIYFAFIAGERAANMYAIEDAINSYQRALTSLETLKETHSIDYCLINEQIGDVYVTCGKYKESNDAFQKSLSIWKNVGSNSNKIKYLPKKYSSKTQESSLCRKIAMTQQELSNYDESLDWLDKAIEKLPSRPGRVASQIFASKSGTYYRKGQLQDAITWGKKALQIAKRLKINAETAYAHKILANAHMWAGKFDQAIKQLDNAATCYEDMEDIIGIGSTYNNIGVCNHLLGKLDEAGPCYIKALDAYRRVHNEAQVAVLNNNLGEIELVKGNMESAIDHFEMTVKAYDKGKCEKPLAGLALVNICRCSRAKNDLSSAEAYLTRGRSLLKEVGSDALILESELDLAELYIDQKKHKQALELSENNLAKLKELDVAPLLVRAYRILGNAFSVNDNINAALPLLLESIKQSKKINAEHEEAKSITLYAKLLIDNNQINKKLSKQLENAIKIFKNMGANYDLKEANDLYQRTI